MASTAYLMDYSGAAGSADFSLAGAGTTTTSVTVNDEDSRGLNNRRKFVVGVATRKMTNPGGQPDISGITLNGVALTLAVDEQASLSPGYYDLDLWYLDDASIPADGTYDLAVTVTSTGQKYGSVHWAMFGNVQQGAPTATAGAQDLTTTQTISVSNPHPVDSLSVFQQGNGDGVSSWLSHDNTQVEITDDTSIEHTASMTYTNSELSIGTPFSSTAASAQPVMLKVAANWDSDPAQIQREFASVVSVTSTVSGSITRPFNAQTIIVQSAVVAGNLLRNRGYVSTTTASTTVTPVLELDRIISSQTTAASTVTVQPFVRDTELAALVEPTALISGIFSATRPLASVTNAVAVVTPSFGNTFEETQYSPTPGDYVELYEIDTTGIGGVDVFRFIPHRFETPDVEVQWKGNTFIQFPVEIDGFEQQATGTAPPQPTMRVANVNKFILAAVLELGDIVGAKVTRWRTYARFLDNGETPDSSAHYAPDIYYVQQKTGHTREGFEFTLSSALDLPGIKLPRRQILKDQSSDDRNLYAPGVANVRFRGR